MRVGIILLLYVGFLLRVCSINLGLPLVDIQRIVENGHLRRYALANTKIPSV